MKLNGAWLHVLCEAVGELGQFTVRIKHDFSCVLVMCNCLYAMTQHNIDRKF